jgi:hypothetical protein
LAAESVSGVHRTQRDVHQQILGRERLSAPLYSSRARLRAVGCGHSGYVSPRQLYAANILSALVWAPAHVFPGVLLGMAMSLAGVSAGQRTLLIVAGLIVISAAVWAIRFYLRRHPLPPAEPKISRA